MGLKQSWDFKVQHLVIESDGLELIHEIKKVRDMNELVLPELKEISIFFYRAQELQVIWCQREVNEVTELLAKQVFNVSVDFL